MGDARDWDDDNGTTMRQPPPPIAIVGMGLRLPGGVNSASSLWDLLVNKRNGRCLVPASRYNVDSFYKPAKTTGSVASRYGYFLQDGVDRFDASFFSMSKAEVDKLDPQQRLLLEVVWECMESGGQKDWRGGNIGCYVGVFGDDWLDMGAKDAQNAGLYRISGSESLGVSNRISYEFDLKGPSMTIRTGCSSSLVALHEACQALYNAECTSAVVAGCNLILTPTMTMAMTEQGVLSPEGISRSFDASANGYGRGEGINAVMIKTLADAIRDGDPIRAVIRATATNCDGKTAGISMPNPEAHESMIRRAYEVAGIQDFSQTAFVECHATGTSVGDPLEARAVARVFGSSRGVYIGSIKPNIGHGEGASGISSLIKTVLALEKRIIPPNIFFDTPNPKIPFEDAHLRVAIEPTSWPAGQLERASVNSFGIGGANAHVILESAASYGITSARKRVAYTRPQLLLFSSNDQKSLQKSVQAHEAYLNTSPHSLGDLSYTLAVRRDHLAYRAFAVKSGDTPIQPSSFAKAKRVPELVFIFTGQGAQWAQMGKELINDFPSFLRDVENMQNALEKLPHPPSWLILDELLKPAAESLLAKSEYAQPLCTAIQVGLVNILKSWGVQPAAVIGHSSGEIAAAYASGAITAAEAITVAYYRGRGTTDVHKPGGMAAVGLGRDEVTPFLQDGVVIACDNSPQSVTLSGDESALGNVMSSIKDTNPDVFLRRLHVEMAYHSHHMRGIGQAYESSLDAFVAPRAITVPFYSSVTGRLEIRTGALGATYWRTNLESPVLFYSAVMSYLKSATTDSLFVEVGPHSALGGPLRQIFKTANSVHELSYISCLERRKDCTATLLGLAGYLYQRSISLNLSSIVSKASVLTDLSTYPWSHDTTYWSENRTVQDWRLRKFPRHELLGSRILEGNDLEPTWRCLINLEDVHWIRDHRLKDDIVFPAAGYISMAGEASRQLSTIEDYTLHNVAIKTALVMKEGAGVELMTSLRPSRLTDSLDSAWYDFTISSFNGVWVKHCSGQVKPGGSSHGKISLDSLPRLVPEPYEAMKSVGLNYGPHFQGLTKTSALPGSTTAVGKMSAPKANIQDCYQLHPTSIDFCLQLFMIAVSEGVPRRLDQLFVPTEIAEIYIGKTSPSSDLIGRATALAGSTASIRGNAIATSMDGDIVFCLSGGRFSPVETETTEMDNVAASEIIFKPDIDLICSESLIHPRHEDKMRESWLLVEKLSLMCMLEMRNCAESAKVATQHLEKFRSWLRSHLQLMNKDSHVIAETVRQGNALSSAERCAKIETLAQEAMATQASAVANLVKRIFENYEDLFQGTIEPLEILLPDDGLTKFYNVLEGRSDYSDFFFTLGHSNPGIKVLEIGAGTGGTASRVLNALTAPNGVRLYAKYCYTDISSGFFPAAKERFKEFSNIEFATLDITKDPLTQNFEGNEFDLIIAANVLHATPSLNLTLRNVRKLIAPNGRLFLQELNPAMMKSINFIMGILPGWWLGENDDRSLEPYINASRWDAELRAAGFSGTESAVRDDEEPYQMNANIISRPSTSEIQHRRGQISILAYSERSHDVQELEKVLVHRGYQPEYYTVDDSLPVDQDIISTLELSNPFFHAISDREFTKFQKLMADLGTNRLLWLTRSSQTNCDNPRFGLVLGLARTLRSEMSINFTTLELDKLDFQAWKSVAGVFEKIQSRQAQSAASEIDPDFEYVLSNGVVEVGRYHAVKVPHQLSAAADVTAPKRLKVGKLGLLQSLTWEQQLPLPNLGHCELEVEPTCVGLNFRDVLSAMGIIEASKGGLGLETSAIVRKVGTGVHKFAVGDRVMVFRSGCFSTRMNVSCLLCAKIPDNISDEEAATIPTVYSTVIHSLMNLGNLRKDQTVLIHSACGGVGLAAIQLCKSIGASIYVTAGNEEKVQFLQTEFGIPRNRIFNSRDSSFLPDLMRETQDRGVDLVLNSLSGDLLHSSWKCVAPGGRFIELGKRDFIGRGKLSMDIFEDNRSFFGVDLNRFTPEQCQPLLQTTVKLLQEGKIKPINPRKTFRASGVEDAFRYMQKGVHIGKVLVLMPDNFDDIQTTKTSKLVEFDGQKTYMLVGGLGGLGRAISTWMIERGARHFLYLSRSAGCERDRPFIEELEAQGCSVATIAGSVSNIEDVERAVSAAMSPIGGVLQMSMILRDTLFSEQGFDDWGTVVDPKIQGTWNLHHALNAQTPDFFVLFSSISGIVGTRGQAAYAAANTFLDSFVSYRHRLDLPASALDIGMMTGIGYLAENTSLQDLLKAQDNHALSETDLIDALQLSISSNIPSKHSAVKGISNPAHLVLGLRSRKPLSDPSNRAFWRHDRRMLMYHNTSSMISTNETSGNDGLIAFMDSIDTDASLLDADSSLSFLSKLIGSQIYIFMMHPIEELDVSQTLSGLGVDSLVTIEIRNWWRRSLGLEASTLEILGAGTIGGLAKLAVQGLKQKSSGSS